MKIWRTVSGKWLPNKAFNIDKNLKYDGYQRGIASAVYKVFNNFFKSASLSDKSVAGSGIKNEIKQNKKLAEELHKPVVRKFERRQVYLSSKDKSVDLYWSCRYAINK